MAKGYIIGHITVNDLDAYQEYVAQNTPILTKYGGRPLIRGGPSETPEGVQFTRHVVFEFDSFEAAKAHYTSPEYQEVMAIRHANADSMIVLAEGVDT